jgi:hypothetical protein
MEGRDTRVRPFINVFLVLALGYGTGIKTDRAIVFVISGDD